MMPAAGTAQAPDTACVVHIASASAAGAVSDLARLTALLDVESRESFLVWRPGRAPGINVCHSPWAVRHLARQVATGGPREGVRPLPAEALVVGNSAYPRDWNDGALWSGRGLNAAIVAGGAFRYGPFSAALAPVLAWQSNASFDLQPVGASQSGFAKSWAGTSMDAPQRFGSSPFTHADPGQSYVRVDVRGVGAGISNENMVWGPARRNPLLLSATAPGFPHAFLETSSPVDIGIGYIDFQVFWGRLTESPYFDDEPDNDHRMLAGLMAAFQPDILDGLAIGGGRFQTLTWWPELSLSDVVIGPYTGLGENPRGRSGDNQLITLFFRWAIAPHGLEVYGEWGREDHWGEWVELLRNLDSSQAWTLGLQKFLPHGDNGARISIEMTHLGDALPGNFASRGTLSWYHNSSVRQGHTHHGQLLGAPIGTGAESLFIGADYFWSRGRTGLSIERARYEDEVYLERFAADFGAHARDTEFSLRAGHFTAFGSLSLDAEFGWSVRYNRNFLGLDALAPGEPYRRDHNWAVRIGTRWTP